MAHAINQALYGYSDGHGLLAASQPLEARDTRELRTFTDMAFDGISGHYLTCLPVEVLRQQALVRTWPAPESSRAGSVWSHALFIDFVDLGEIRNLGGLLSLFRYPQIDEPGKPLLGPYELPISLSGVPGANADDRAPALPADDRLILWATYGHEPPSVVRTADPATLESALIRLWEQQWPRLRRSFSFRTRYRVSSQYAGTFDVNVVERLERDQSAVELPLQVPGWVERLAEDLAEPEEELRAFLRRYGAESTNARSELAPLLEIRELLVARKRAGVPPRVWSAFPDASQMRTLKRALFGDAHENSELWRAPEQERLTFVLQASPPTAVDLEDLKVLDRLHALWQANPNQAVKVLTGSEPCSSPQAAKLIATSTAKYAPAEQLAALAEQQPELVTAAVRERPELRGAPELWSGPTASRELASDLFNDSDQGTREEILLELLRHNRGDAAGAVVEQQPPLWWLALNFEADRVEASSRELQPASERLRHLLDASGPAAIGSMPMQIGSSAALRLLAVTLPPDAGLWRQADPHRWVQVAPDVAAIQPESVRLRALVVLLSATRLASRDTRRQLWLLAFTPLHAALVCNQLEPSDWEALDALLPTSPTDDHADRLRHGALDAIVRDKWPAHDVQAIIAGAHPFEASMLAALRSRRKKSKGWLRELVDQLVP